MYDNGFQYRTINVHRSALSSVLPHIDGNPVGQTLLVKRLLKGILRKNPPLPRYKETWDIDLILKYFMSLSDNSELDMKTLSKKLATLLAITAPKRASEIVRLDTRFMHIGDDGVTFQLPGLSKTQSDCTPKEVFYSNFPSNKKLCILDCLQNYLILTKKFRDSDKSKANPLIRTMVKPHKQLSPTTLANWIKQVLKVAGVDTDKFKAHSTRSASTSKARDSGIAINDIMKMADWSNARTFQRFYYRNTNSQSNKFGNAVLTLGKFSL